MSKPLPAYPLEGADRETLLTFPCRFPVKVMGAATETFEVEIRAIFARHVPDLTDDCVVVRGSREGRFLALTVTFEARSQAQLDGLYMELTAHPDVKMCL